MTTWKKKFFTKIKFVKHCTPQFDASCHRFYDIYLFCGKEFMRHLHDQFFSSWESYSISRVWSVRQIPRKWASLLVLFMRPSLFISFNHPHLRLKCYAMALLKIAEQMSTWCLITQEVKLQMFQLKIIQNMLPTRRYLFRARLSEPDSCRACQNEPETLPHMLFQCNIISAFWIAFQQ